MSQSGGKRKTRKRVAKRRPAQKKAASKTTRKSTRRPVKRVAKRVAKRKPAAKSKPAKSQAKRKGTRKRTSSLSSKYSIEMLVSPHADSSHLSNYQLGGGLEDLDHGMDQANEDAEQFYNELKGTRSSGRRVAKRKATKRRSGKRRTRRRKSESEEEKPKRRRRKASKSSGRKPGRRVVKRRAPAGLKELATMGHDRLRYGLSSPITAQLPLDSKYLLLNPELRKQVAMSDPVARNMLSEYGPGWSGYQLGLQVRGSKKGMMNIERSAPSMGMAMHPNLHPAIMGHGLSAYGMGSNPIALSSMLLGGPLANKGRVSDWGLKYGLAGSNVQVEEGLDRVPEERMNVKSELPFGSPGTMTVAHVGVGTDAMPSMACRRNPNSKACLGYEKI